MKEKQAVTREYAPRYRKAEKKAKSALLNEFIRLTGYHRKSAVRLLNAQPVRQVLVYGEGKTKLLRLRGKPVKARISHKTGKKRVYEKRYSPEVAACVARLWEFFNGMCGKRLVSLIRANIAVLAGEPRFGITQDSREQLVRISRSTVERMLKGERKKRRLKGRSTTRPGSLLKHQIPVKVSWPWNEQLPGFCEIDTVSHDGGNASGDFCYTLTVTGIATR
jgi:hypothetical protein